MVEKIKILLITIFVLLPTASLASYDLELEVDWPLSPINDLDLTDGGIARLSAYLYEWGIVIGVIIFFGVLVFAGFEYLSSAGKPSRMTSAKKRIFAGFAGLFLLLGSYLLLEAINPELTQIEEIGPPDTEIGIHEFQTGGPPLEDMCEFGFLTISEERDPPSGAYYGGDRSERVLLIPGRTIETDKVFPEESDGCTPEINHQKIREVREKWDPEEEQYKYILVKRHSGEEIVDNNEDPIHEDVWVGENQSDIEDIFSDRYKDYIQTSFTGDEELFTDWRMLKHKRLFNSFFDGQCEDLIANPNFDRPRCLELEYNGGVQIREWKKYGFPSLLKALHTIKDEADSGELLELNDGQTCPTAEEMEAATGTDTDLGYELDETGGGCSIAFYDGEERSVPVFGTSRPTCTKQVSRPSATMDHYDGVVDREINCLEMIRHEPELEVKEEEFEYVVSLEMERIEDPEWSPIGSVKLERNGVHITTLQHGEQRTVPEGTYDLIWEKLVPLTSFEVDWESPCTHNETVSSTSTCENVTIDGNMTIELRSGYD